MAIDTVQGPERYQLPIASEGEAPPSSFEAEELDIAAFRLWQRCNCLELVSDECCFCNGDAQRCLAMCQ